MILSTLTIQGYCEDKYKLMYTNDCTYGWSDVLRNTSKLLACWSDKESMSQGNIMYYSFLPTFILEGTSENIKFQYIRMTLKIWEKGQIGPIFKS